MRSLVNRRLCRGSYRIRFAERIKLHDLVGPAALAKQAGHGLHRRTDVFEELLVAGTQVIEPRLAIRGSDEAVAGTLAVTGEAHFTLPAIFGQAVQLVQPERALLLRANQLRHGRPQDVPQQIAGLDVVIAGIKVAVV